MQFLIMDNTHIFAYIKLSDNACVPFSEGLCLTIRRYPAVALGTPTDKCSRVCLAVEGGFWTIFGKMKDGTPCPPTDKAYKDGRCIGGSCLVSFQQIKHRQAVTHDLTEDKLCMSKSCNKAKQTAQLLQLATPMQRFEICMYIRRIAIILYICICIHTYIHTYLLTYLNADEFYYDP